MPRKQIGSVSQPSIRPQAQPVSTFHRTSEGDGLKQLAEALSQVAPAIGRFGSAIEERSKRIGTEQGTAYARTLFDEIKETGRQIRAEEIAPSESKWFRLAAREQFGRLLAAKYSGDLNAAVIADEGLQHSTTVDDFDGFEATFKKDWLAQHLGDSSDPALEAGFGPTAQAYMFNTRNAFIAQAGKRLEGAVIEQTYQEHQATAAQQLLAGASYEEVGAAIGARNAALYQANPKSGAALNQTTLKAVIDMAIMERRVELLELLDHIPGPKGSILGKTSTARAAVEAAKRTIYADRMQEYNIASTEEKQVRNDAVDAVFDSLYDAMDQNEDDLSKVDVTEFAKALQQNPHVRQEDITKLYKAYDAYRNATDTDDLTVANGLWDRAFQGSLRSTDVSSAFEARQITVSTARKLRQELGLARSGRKAKALTEDSQFKSAASSLRRLFVDEYGVNPFEARWRADQAVTELTRQWIEWRRGPEGQAAAADASGQSFNDFLQTAKGRIFSGFAGKDLTDQLKKLPTATRPADAGPVHWTEGQVVDYTTLQQVSAEVAALQNGSRNRLSPEVEALFARQGIKDIKEALIFIADQRDRIPFRDRH